MNSSMTSMERVMTAVGHNEPDRVPLILLTTMHGAKELGMSIKEYFSRSANVIEGQLRLQKKYRNDCFYAFFYAPIESETFGGEVIFADDGPPNTGEPCISNDKDILSLKAPVIRESKNLVKVLEAIEGLKKKREDVPIIGVAISPFSLPVMQMGFEGYLDLIYEKRDLFEKLMEVNIEFSTNWANAQLEAGASAICYFDPVSSPSMIPRDLYIETGFKVAKQAISMIKGPTATHLASGTSLPIADILPDTGTFIVGVSANEDMAELKSRFRNKLTLLGNLNGIEMRRWSRDETEKKVKEIIRKAGVGGGLFISDNHGEIPWQVPDDVLLDISDAVHKWGNYPLSWIREN